MKKNGGAGGLFKQMQNMHKKIADIEKQLETSEFMGKAGGGEGDDQDSECTMLGNGKYEITKVTIGQRFVKLLGEEESKKLISLLQGATQGYFDEVLGNSSGDMQNIAENMDMPMDMLMGNKASPMNMDLGNLQSMMKNLQEMQKKIVEVEKRLDAANFYSSRGTNELECTIQGSGKYRINKLQIGSHFTDLMGEEEAELLSDLFAATIHDYCKRVKNSSGTSMAGIASGMGLPPDMLQDSMEKLLGPSDETEDEF